ncbi:hypothetical protein RvY_12366-2 [Ramazzottius varieornatus]|uniref:Uncharacterized protein n=1 Tax=Ramazzottius varieornatus TaxID=947166 RepID=A0A1D1VNG1_RAMVA|nr:hypothetical protein RvY_12366-2 [Ramazzottius varieornatus]
MPRQKKISKRSKKDEDDEEASTPTKSKIVKKTGKRNKKDGPTTKLRRSTRRKDPHKFSHYVEQLHALPATKIGLGMIVKALNERLDDMIGTYGLEEGDLNDGVSLASLLETVNNLPEVKAAGPYGKVGMHVRKDTLDQLQEELNEDALNRAVLSETQPEPGEALADEGYGSMPVDGDVTLSNLELEAESAQETLEGLDRDLLGVNSQAALDKITKFVTKTIADNHPGKNAPPSASALVLPTQENPTSSLRSQAKAPSPFKFAFLSVVATYDAKCHVPLQDLHARLRCVDFDPTWFHSAALTFPKSECRVAIFENGKFVITGVTTIKMSLIAARNVLEIFKMCDYNPEINKRNFKAKNLTAMLDLGVNIDIAGFAEKYPANTYMDQDTFGAITHFPEKSPNLIQKGGLGLCMLIFATGRIVLVGGKTEKHMITVFRDKVMHILKPFAFGW